MELETEIERFKSENATLAKLKQENQETRDNLKYGPYISCIFYMSLHILKYISLLFTAKLQMPWQYKCTVTCHAKKQNN